MWVKKVARIQQWCLYLAPSSGYPWKKAHRLRGTWWLGTETTWRLACFMSGCGPEQLQPGAPNNRGQVFSVGSQWNLSPFLIQHWSPACPTTPCQGSLPNLPYLSQQEIVSPVDSEYKVWEDCDLFEESVWLNLLLEQADTSREGKGPLILDIFSP